MRSQAVVRICVLLVIGVAGCATMQARSQTKKIDQLNEEALKEFKAGKHKEADKTLAKALEEAEKAKLGNHEVAAKTHMNRGVVLATGLKRRKRAVEAMVLALTIDPNAKPAEALRDKRVDKSFALAQEQIAAAAPPPPPEPAPEPEPVAVAAEPAPPAPAPEPKPAKAKKGKAAVKAEVRAEVKVDPPVTVAAETANSSPAEEAKVPVVVAAPTPPPAPAQDLEAELPNPLPKPIFCPLPEQVPPAQALPVWCGVDSSLRANGVTLFVRPRGKAEFIALPMKKSDRGWWVATVEGSDVGAGGMLQYYVQAEGANAKVVANAADAYSPDLVLLHPRAKKVPSVLTQAYLDGDVDMELDLEPVPEELPKRGFDWQRVWVGVQVGTGYGHHAAGDLEFRKDISVEAGTASAGILHVLPEFGYQYSDRWAFSLQTRHQILPNEGDTGGRPGRPAPGANAALARAIYNRPVAARFSVLGSAALGVGEGFRFVMDPMPSMGRSGTDSVVAGPILLGAGAGGLLHVTQKFAVVAELRALVGLPKFGVLGEFNLGLRYSFSELSR